MTFSFPDLIRQKKKKEAKAAAKAAKKEAKAKRKAEKKEKKDALKQLKKAAKTGDADAEAKYKAQKEEYKKSKAEAKAAKKAAKAEKKAKKAEAKKKKKGASAAAAASAESKKQIFVGDDYKLENKMDEDVLEAFNWDVQSTSTFTKDNFLEKLPEFRAGMTPPDEMPKTEYTDLCDIEEIAKFGGPAYHKDAVANNCFVHRKKGSTGIKPAVVYWHGGATVAGDAKAYCDLMNRIASDSDVTVFNCNYGLCPERIAPLGIQDAYAQLKEVLKNHEKYKVDPKRVCIMGESGGGYICVGVALMLAENNESHLVKLSYPMIPQCDASYFEKDVDDTWTAEEKAYKGLFMGVNQCHLKDNKCARHWIFPNTAPDALIQKCPPTLLLSVEFDFFRKACETMAKIYKKNGKLLEFGIMRGVQHGHFFDPSCKRTAAWFKAIQDGLKVHLV